MYMSVKLQKHTDTGWENLNPDGTIIGRILNGMATIRIWKYNLQINVAKDPYQIVLLPEKYVPSRSVPFLLTRELASPETVSGLVLIDAPARIRVYSTNTGKFVLYGSVTYPV